MKVEEFIRRYPPVDVERWQLGSAEPVLTLAYSEAGMRGPHINYRASGWQALWHSLDHEGYYRFRFPLGWTWWPRKDPWLGCAQYLGLEERGREAQPPLALASMDDGDCRCCELHWTGQEGSDVKTGRDRHALWHGGEA